jgi:acyl-CoA-dependent ceramide synthase
MFAHRSGNFDSQTSRSRPPIPDYPHWQMTPELKRYYLMQASYWCQQFIVLVFGLEKPRKDYRELVAHHVVTLWLVGSGFRFRYTRTSILTSLFPDGVMGST